MIPEAGPLLGRLLHPPRGDLGICPGLDQIRADLLTGLFDRTGAARDLDLVGDHAGARAALGRPAWLEIWEPAVQRAGEAVSLEIGRRLSAAAAVSRIPARRLKAALPGEEERRVLEARLSAAGIRFEAASARLAGAAGEWEEEFRKTVGALEESWSSLIAVAREELAGWDSRATELRQWRRPWTPLVIAGAGALTLATLAGLVLGGYLPTPAWFRPVAEWIWSLGWP